MGESLDKYKILFKKFLGNIISVDEFKTNYLDLFKQEEFLNEPLFEILDGVFGDVDSFTDDAQLLAENPDFYLDEVRLRQKIQQAANRLSNLGK